MRITDYLKFFRWQNILLIILIQCSIKCFFFNKFDLSTVLDTLHFGLLILSTVCIAIGGYIINDMQDVGMDKINKPAKVFVGNKITAKQANTLYIVFNSIGLLLAFYLSYFIGKNSFFTLFLIASLLLYTYATKLKKQFLIGNLSVAFLIFLCVLLVPIFDVVPVSNALNQDKQIAVFKIVFCVAAFAFWLNLIREFIKDCEDIDGDRKFGVNSLANKLSVATAVKISLVLMIGFILTLIYTSYSFLLQNTAILIYLIITVLLPGIYSIMLLIKAKSKSDFSRISLILKLIMLFGVLSLILY